MLNKRQNIQKKFKRYLFFIGDKLFSLRLFSKLLECYFIERNKIIMQTPLRKTYDNPEHHDFNEYNGKCVCDICNCSKHHRCPEPGYRIETQTTNHFFYKPHNIANSPSRRARAEYSPSNLRYEPEDLKTNYQTFYTPHKLEQTQQRARPATSKRQYQPSPFKLEGETEYKSRYSPHKITTESGVMPRLSPKKREYVPSPHKFQGETTYNNHFSPKKAELSPSPRKKLEYSPSKHKLQTQTTYGKFYQPHKAEAYSRSPESKKKYVYLPNDQKFEGVTRYRQFYRPLELPQRQRCPTDYLPKRPYRCSPDKNHTYYNSGLNQWE